MEIPLGDILSVTTGKLVSRDHIGGVYNLCNFITGASNITHQLPRVADEIRPEIFKQHPKLINLNMSEYPKQLTEESVKEWLTKQEAIFGKTLQLQAMESYVGVHPLQELDDIVSKRIK